METISTIELRKSTRGFKDMQIPDVALDAILHAGKEAPVAMGAFQSMHVTILQDTELIRKISEVTSGTNSTGADIFYNAPTLIIVSSMQQPTEGFAYCNAGCICENMLLAATDLGMGSVFIFGMVEAFEKDPTLLHLCEIPDGFYPVSSIAIGYATDEAMAIPKQQRTITFNVVSCTNYVI
ncbi:MAG: nitroreductase family protein [Clostridiales Family XIII bacterium]|jgi:nitroreductase|nr:nitroreductase family protein [Clostridiales Family XIII bacterium]